MWLNDKEEEEVNYDWSDRNTNMAAKKDNYSVCSNSNNHSFLQIDYRVGYFFQVFDFSGANERAGAEGEEN